MYHPPKYIITDGYIHNVHITFMSSRLFPRRLTVHTYIHTHICTVCFSCAVAPELARIFSALQTLGRLRLPSEQTQTGSPWPRRRGSRTLLSRSRPHVLYMYVFYNQLPGVFCVCYRHIETYIRTNPQHDAVDSHGDHRKTYLKLLYSCTIYYIETNMDVKRRE